MIYNEVKWTSHRIDFNGAKWNCNIWGCLCINNAFILTITQFRSVFWPLLICVRRILRSTHTNGGWRSEIVRSARTVGCKATPSFSGGTIRWILITFDATWRGRRNSKKDQPRRSAKSFPKVNFLVLINFPPQGIRNIRTLVRSTDFRYYTVCYMFSS